MASAIANVRALGEVALALSPWAPASRPHRLEAVRERWLASVLAGDRSDAAVVAIRDLGGTRGTTDRRRLQLTWNRAGQDARLPTRLFIKATSPSPKNRTMAAALSMAVNEVRFYREIRPSLGDIAPRAYYASAGHGARFMLVLDDLGAAGATLLGPEDELTIDHARALVATFARLHAAFWQSPRFEADLCWVARMHDRAGFALLARQFRRTRNSFLERADERNLSAPVRRMLRTLNEHDARLYRSWSEGPQTLAHGDTHAGNTYALPDGRAGLLDWQVVFRTRGIRELSYLIVPALETEDRRKHEQHLVRHYVDRLAAAGVREPPTFEEAWDDYRFFAHDAWDSVALTLSWPGLHPTEALERAFSRCCAAVEDLAIDESVASRARR